MGNSIVAFLLDNGLQGVFSFVFVLGFVYIIMSIRNTDLSIKHTNSLLSNHISETNKKIDNLNADIKEIQKDIKELLKAVYSNKPS